MLENGEPSAASEVINMSNHLEKLDEIMYTCIEPMAEDTGGVITVGSRGDVFGVFWGLVSCAWRDAGEAECDGAGGK